MDEQIQEAVNAQIRLELYSGYLYVAMSAHFAEHDFVGFAKWMRLQAREEFGHAMRLYDYTLERGGHVELRSIDAPPKEFGRPAEIFETALAHEKKVTEKIHAIYDLARERKDYATEVELQWFVKEQVEEENTAGLAVRQLRRAGDEMPALLMLDQRFGQRSEG